ncbi:MAG: hypothetical protein IPG45_06005 [Deltaproteobacteria bacterium]|nr:hypothetical protein [Deltaproteobacteria bacterium]
MARRRMARGWFGGKTAQSLGGVQLEITMTIPVFESIELTKESEALLYKRVGQALAADIRKTLKAGNSPDGTPLPQPQGLGKDKRVKSPLNRTGKLIESIKYRGGIVAPSTNTRPGMGKRVRNNFGLNKILVSGRLHGRHKQDATIYGPVDPLGALDEKLGERVNAIADKVARKMVLKGELKAKPGHEQVFTTKGKGAGRGAGGRRTGRGSGGK